MKRATTEARFWAYVDKTPTCWIWRGPMASNGKRGSFSVNGRKWSPAIFVYQLLYGEYPTGYTTPCPDHPRCIRPDHCPRRSNQEMGRETARQKGLGKSNHARAHGEDAGNVRLTATQVRKIRSQYKYGATAGELATRFHCSPQNIHYIVAGKTWRHLLTADELAALEEGAA